MVKNNLPSNAGDIGSIPAQETEIPHVLGQLEKHESTATEPQALEPLLPKRSPPTARRGPCTAAREGHVATRNSPHHSKDPAQAKGKQNEENNPKS